MVFCDCDGNGEYFACEYCNRKFKSYEDAEVCERKCLSYIKS